jgi:amino acid transporter
MGIPNDIEMNRHGRAYSPTEGSTFTALGVVGGGDASIISSSGAPGRPGSSRGAGGPNIGANTMHARVGRFLDSFKREEGAALNSNNNNSNVSLHATDSHPATRDHHGYRYYDIRSANSKTATTLLARELKGRHLQMIAISGSIGTGLFVASGRALSQGGPASLLLAYLIVGVMVWCTMQALGEMAVVFPVAGSFSAFSTRFLDPSWGFAMGWK